jgi:hypothetical protein
VHQTDCCKLLFDPHACYKLQEHLNSFLSSLSALESLHIADKYNRELSYFSGKELSTCLVQPFAFYCLLESSFLNLVFLRVAEFLHSQAE